MDNNFLIPANSKRSMLIFGIFRRIDLIIFASGGLLTFLLIFINSPVTLMDVFIDLLPFLIAGAMIVPIPNQMNLWSFTVNIYAFLTNQRDYRWRGWCKCYGDDEQNKQQ